MNKLKEELTQSQNKASSERDQLLLQNTQNQAAMQQKDLKIEEMSNEVNAFDIQEMTCAKFFVKVYTFHIIINIVYWI